MRHTLGKVIFDSHYAICNSEQRLDTYSTYAEDVECIECIRILEKKKVDELKKNYNELIELKNLIYEIELKNAQNNIEEKKCDILLK